MFNSNCKTCSDSANNCLSCDEGLFLNSVNSCSECIYPCKTCSNEDTCLSCADNYFLLTPTVILVQAQLKIA